MSTERDARHFIALMALAASFAPSVPMPMLRAMPCRSRGPAPINWSSFRPLAEAMLEAREALLIRSQAVQVFVDDLGVDVSGFKHVQIMSREEGLPKVNANTAALGYALTASSEYILELSRCMVTRPQGKGGWQRAARLDALLAQVEAALDAA